MIDQEALRTLCQQLSRRLEGRLTAPELRRVYLDMNLLVGQLQAAVGESIRLYGSSEDTAHAERALGSLKDSTRQVGYDIRLASESALQLGLQTALSQAAETIRYLQQVAPSE